MPPPLPELDHEEVLMQMEDPNIVQPYQEDEDVDPNAAVEDVAVAVDVQPGPGPDIDEEQIAQNDLHDKLWFYSRFVGFTVDIEALLAQETYSLKRGLCRCSVPLTAFNFLAYSWISIEYSILFTDDVRNGNFYNKEDMAYYLSALIGCSIMSAVLLLNLILMGVVYKNPFILLKPAILYIATAFYFFWIYSECLVLASVGNNALFA